MNKIDKAKGVEDLLDAKKRYDKAKAPAKPYIAYEIVTWRKYLGMTITTSGNVLDRLRANPVDSSKTLTAAEYAKQIKKWLPESYIDLSSCGDENAKGVATALQTVLLHFPKLAERDGEDGYLDMLATHEEFDKFQRENWKSVKNYREKVIKRERLYEKHDQLFGEQVAEYTKKIVEMSGGTLDYKTAKIIAKNFGLARVTSISRACKKAPVDAQAFMDLCHRTARERMVNQYVEKKIRDGNSGLAKLVHHDVRGDMQNPRVLALFSRGGFSRGIVLGQKFSSDEELAETAKESVNSGWAPKIKIDTPTRAAEMSMMHELGHVLDSLLSVQISPMFIELQRDIGLRRVDNYVSRYGAKNYDELIAEAFVDYMLSDEPKPISIRIVGIIQHLYQQKFGGR